MTEGSRTRYPALTADIFAFAEAVSPSADEVGRREFLLAPCFAPAPRCYASPVWSCAVMRACGIISTTRSAFPTLTSEQRDDRRARAATPRWPDARPPWR